MRKKQTIAIHRLRHFQAMRHADLEILRTMAGRSMDKARAGFIGDMITGKKRHIEVKALAAPGMGTDGFSQNSMVHIAQDFVRGDPGLGADFFQQNVGHDHFFPRPGQGSFGHRLDLDQAID